MNFEIRRLGLSDDMFFDQSVGGAMIKAPDARTVRIGDVGSPLGSEIPLSHVSELLEPDLVE